MAESRGPHFAWWCENKLQHTVDHFDGEKFVLEDWQRAIVDEALKMEEGRYIWRSVAIVLPRKNGKTALLAAYALYRLIEDRGSPEILLAAASDKQAGRLFDAVVAYIRRSPELNEILTIRDYQGEIVRKDGEGKILRMSSSPERLHGYNPSLVVLDEVAQWTTPTLRKAWAALTTGGGARSSTQTFTISTAGEGHERSESILGRLIDGNEAMGEIERKDALTVSRNEAAETLVFNYSAPTNKRDDTDAVKQANPASWITSGYLSRQGANPELTTAEFLQLHACVWADSDKQWIASDVWKRNHREGVLERLEPICLGFDGSVLHDATALVACRVSDARLFLLDVWEKPPNRSGWEVPRDEVDAAFHEAMNTYRVLRCYMDPPFWQTDIARWKREYGEPPISDWLTASSKIGPALERFRTDTITGDLTHNGDPTLSRHVVNARMEKSRQSYKLTKPGRQSMERIDCAMAAVLAYEARNDAKAAGEDKPRSKTMIAF